MSFLSNVLQYEAFNGKNLLKNAWDNPDQMLLGAADPFSAGMWSKITGKDYKPLVGWFGGSTDETNRRAEAAGIDTKNGRKMQDWADGIAAYAAAGYGASAGLGAMGGGGGSSTGGLLNFSGGQQAAPIVDMSTAASPQTVSAISAAPTAASSSGGGWQTAGQFAGAANQSGLLGGKQKQQPQQLQHQQANTQAFAGLLSPTDQVNLDRRRQAQQMAVQGLLGGYRG